MEVKYYVCNHCENIIEMVKDKGVPVICCGEPMQELKAGVTDAAVEKHVPVYTVEGSHVHVVVGETKHPMLEEHFIEWITLSTNQGIYRKQLNPGQEPVADFCLCDRLLHIAHDVFDSVRCAVLAMPVRTNPQVEIGRASCRERV